MAARKVTAPQNRFATGLLRYFGFRGSTMSGIRTYVKDSLKEAILITFEDEPLNLKTVVQFLEGKGYHVTQFILDEDKPLLTEEEK